MKSSRGSAEHARIDANLAVGYEFPPQTSSYVERDLSLYALGVGFGARLGDDTDLAYIDESNPRFRALPTFGAAHAQGVFFEMAKRGVKAPGLHYGLERVLHHEQYTEVRRPLPARATLTHKGKVKAVLDRGRSAVVVTAMTSYDDSGQELVYNEFSVLVRGMGGFCAEGGAKVPSAQQVETLDVSQVLARPPDAIVAETIPENQAMIYRLSGDMNRLHIDPFFAKKFGFRRPILHGLCTFGVAARHLVKAHSSRGGGDLKSLRARFSGVVFPGETLQTEMWFEAANTIVFQCRDVARKSVVLSNAAVEFHSLELADGT